MTHESSLQQSNGRDDGNALSYRAGSFSYLQKGRIAFRDMIGYQEDQNRDSQLPRYQGETGIYHDMNVSFEGAKGSSDFFASSYFSGRGMIVSENAIRFEEFNRNFSKDRDYNFSTNYSSEKIDLRANAIIGNGRRKDFGYDFLYNATIANGSVETKRTLRLPSNRLSWEQNSLMKGNITLADNLSAGSLVEGGFARIDL